MAPTPSEQDRPAPSRIQRVMMAAMRRPQAGFGQADRGRGGNDLKAGGLPALALARVSLAIDDGVLMALGPEGDPIPPADFVAAAAEQPDAKVAWSGGETVSASQVAAVLEAQSRGPLGLEGGEAWIKAMLGLGPRPAMASEAELRGERDACELTAFGRELMITMPTRRSFLVADAAPAHQAEATVGLTLADGQAVSVSDLVARLRAHVEQTQRAAGRAAGGDPASAEIALPGCAVQGGDDALLLQLPAVGVARLAHLGSTAAAGPRISIFRTNGEAAGMADMIAELGRAPIPAPQAAAGIQGAAVVSPPTPSVAPAGGAVDRGGAAGPSMAAAVPLAVTLPGVAGGDAERVVVVVIGGLPQGAVLSAGVDNGDGSWMLSPRDLAGLALTAPAACREDVVLTVTAVAVENREGEMTAVSDTIRLSLDRSAPVALAIDPAVLQAGGPGLNALVIRDLPEGARLSAGTYDPAIDGWVLLPRQLAGLTLTPPDGQAGFTLTVLGISLGADGGGQAKVLTRLPIAAG